VKFVCRLIVVLPLLLAIGCAPSVDVKYDFDESADFAAIKTYDIDLQASGGDGHSRLSAYQDIDVRKGILWAIDRGMGEEGMVKQPVNPDIVVVFHIAPVVTDDAQPFSQAESAPTSVALTLDFKRGGSTETVWKGTGEVGVNVDMAQTDFNKMMYQAVEQLLKKYPPM